MWVNEGREERGDLVEQLFKGENEWLYRTYLFVRMDPTFLPVETWLYVHMVLFMLLKLWFRVDVQTDGRT